MSSPGHVNSPQDALRPAAELLDTLGQYYQRATLRMGLPLELYHRHAVSVRVARHPAANEFELQIGREDGLALRVHDPEEGSLAFTATSGCDAACVDTLIDRVTFGSCATPLASAEPPWQQIEDRVADADPDLRLPTATELEGWLNAAIASLPARDGDALRAARVEVAAVVESWVATNGRRASRSRIRSWAVAEPPGAAEWGVGPYVASSRAWAELPADGWAAIAADRVWPDHGYREASIDGLPLIFSPEASATLVTALVATIHRPGAEVDTPVGPGWRVRDDPLDPSGVFGGAFDDACFDTRPRWLADGRQVVATLEGAGTWRRPSYRDAPQPQPAQLVVEPVLSDLPDDALLVTGLRVHPLSATEWMLELRGGVIHGGEPGPAIDQAVLRASPQALVTRCSAGFGDSKRSWRGVLTPALVFYDLGPQRVG